jgi:O-antigen/teichoic acid export membrane protein
LVGPINWACGAMLVNQPNGYAEMGLYSAANQWRIAILFLPGMLGRVLLPLLSSLHEESSTQKFKKVLVFNLLLNIGIALIVVCPLLLFASFIMDLYGPGFEQGANVLRILSFSCVLVTINSVVGQAIISKSKMWTGLTFNALWGIVLLVSTYMFLRNGYGALGLAYSTLIAYAFHTCWQGIYFVLAFRRNGLMDLKK